MFYKQNGIAISKIALYLTPYDIDFNMRWRCNLFSQFENYNSLIL